MSPANNSTVLIIDDDPSHLKLYSWVLQRGGFHPITALVQSDGVVIPEGERIDVAVLDYRLGPHVTAAEIAKRLRAGAPTLPILVLSDLPWMPDDVASFASGFVRKGEPEQLIETVGSMIGEPPRNSGPEAKIA